MNLSIIVPVIEGDESWHDLLFDFVTLSEGDEVIFVSDSETQCQQITEVVSRMNLKSSVKCISSSKGRALQLNMGAQTARNEILWFLHADSRFKREALKGLKNQIQAHPEAIHFFRLHFTTKNLRLMKLNNWGGRFRSEYLQLPFGDQGLCMHKNIFSQIGGFNEVARCGEDHLLIWQAHQMSIPVLCTKSYLETSPRKYEDQGWLATTIKHLYWTQKKAIPEFIKLVKSRVIR